MVVCANLEFALGNELTSQHNLAYILNVIGIIKTHRHRKLVGVLLMEK